MESAVGIVLAAGVSSRLAGETPKQFRDLAGESAASRSVRLLATCPGIDGVVVVVAPDAIGGPHAERLGSSPSVRAVVPGGATRAASSLAGVEAAGGAAIVLVHDAARPFATEALVTGVLEATRRHGAAIPALAVKDTVKRDDGSGFIGETLPRAPLRLAQTPQGSRRDWLLSALRAVLGAGADVTDEAQALERAGHRVALVPGHPGNIKITTQEDWDEALRRADGPPGEMRIGHGYDIHRFGDGRALVLGGVVFPGETGLAGHSDADAVLHAAMDAVLGAAGMQDIGHRFPPSDPRFAGADSGGLAREVASAVRGAGFRIVNLDLTVLAERPRLAGRVEEMRSAIGAAFGIDAGRVGLKATTLEGLGSLGRGEGIACHAVALIVTSKGAA